MYIYIDIYIYIIYIYIYYLSNLKNRKYILNSKVLVVNPSYSIYACVKVWMNIIAQLCCSWCREPYPNNMELLLKDGSPNYNWAGLNLWLVFFSYLYFNKFKYFMYCRVLQCCVPVPGNKWHCPKLRNFQ